MPEMRTANKNIRLLAVTAAYGIADSLYRISEKIFKRLRIEKYFLEFDTRPDDIYIVTYQKSGTTWMQMIMHQLTSDGNMDFDHINDVVPSLERNIKENVRIDDFPSPRIIKTHFTYDGFPKNWPGRYIYVMRHGMDVAVSEYHHRSDFYTEYK